MKRDPALVPLSHDHHQALFVAQNLRRATPETAADARAAFIAFWQADGRSHFRIEEEILLPAYAEHGDAHDPLVARVLCEHVEIRYLSAHVEHDPDVTAETLSDLGRRLADHVRLEERELFPMIEQALPTAALSALATDLAAAEHGGEPAA